MTERDFQRRVIDLARLCGWHVAHHHDSRRQVRPGVYVGDRDAAGFPDLVLCHPDQRRVLFRELKSPTGRVRPEQAAWMSALVAAGADAAVWRPEDWPRITLELRAPRRLPSAPPSRPLAARGADGSTPPTLEAIA